MIGTTRVPLTGFYWQRMGTIRLILFGILSSSPACHTKENEVRTCVEDTGATGTITVSASLPDSSLTEQEVKKMSETLEVYVYHHSGTSDPATNSADSSVEVTRGEADLDQPQSYDVPAGWTSAGADASSPQIESDTGEGDSGSDNEIDGVGSSEAVCIQKGEVVSTSVTLNLSYRGPD